MSCKATLALLIFGIVMHHSVNCTPAGLSFPSVRYVHFYSSVELYFFQVLVSTFGQGSNAYLSGRRQTKEHILCTVNSYRLMDQWRT